MENREKRKNNLSADLTMKLKRKKRSPKYLVIPQRDEQVIRWVSFGENGEITQTFVADGSAGNNPPPSEKLEIIATLTSKNIRGDSEMQDKDKEERPKQLGENDKADEPVKTTICSDEKVQDAD